MSLYDKMTIGFGSGFCVGVSTLFNLKPINGTGDLTHIRASVATRINEAGLIEEVADNVPRANYPPGGSINGCPSLLLEPQITNLQRRSEEFDNGAWVKSNLIVTADQAISPDGTLNADKLIVNSVSTNSHTYQSVTLVISDDYTQTYFVKASEYNWVQITGSVGFASTFRNFNVSTGESGNGDIPASDFDTQDMGNGWYRIRVTSQATNTNGRLLIAVYNSDVASRLAAFVGDDVSGVFAWGAQIERLDYTTSYIKTVASTVTRDNDQCNNAGTSANFNDSEGVVYCKISALNDTLINRAISISDGTTSNRVHITFSSVTNQIKCDVIDGGVSQASMTHTVSDTKNIVKCAIKYKLNDCAFWVNGVEVDTDTSATMPSGLDELSFDAGNGVEDFYGNCEELVVFNEALSDLELTELTTI